MANNEILARFRSLCAAQGVTTASDPVVAVADPTAERAHPAQVCEAHAGTIPDLPSLVLSPAKFHVTLGE